MSNKHIALDPETAFSSADPVANSPILSTPDRDPPGANSLGLTPEEVEQFREYGFVIKRGLIPPEGFSDVLDFWWEQPPVRASRMRRNDSGTWRSPGRYWPADNRWGLADNWMGNSPWPTADMERFGAETGERVGRLAHKLTRDIGNDVWRWHGIGHDPAFVAATSTHPNVLHMAELIVGGPVKRPHRNRGIYAIFPRSEGDPETALGPHMDQTTTELQVVTYLDDVDARSGGFTIFPGSAQKLYGSSEQALNWVATDASRAELADIKANTVPLEFVGKAGDVLFCHALTLHSAGVHTGERIRMAVIQDFSKVRERSHLRWTAAGKRGGPRVQCNMDGIFAFPTDTDDDPEDGLREVTSLWTMDSNEFVLSQAPPGNDMFADWNLGQVEATGHVVNEPAWWQKYGLSMLPQGNVPRGGGGCPAVSLNEVADYIGDGKWQAVSRANDWMR